MQEFTISSSWLESLNVDYKKILKSGETVTLFSSGQIQIPEKNDNDEPYLAKIEVIFKSEDEQETLLNMVYIFEIVKNFDENFDEDQIKEKLNGFIKTQIYPRVNDYLEKFYDISNIQFLSLPTTDD